MLECINSRGKQDALKELEKGRDLLLPNWQDSQTVLLLTQLEIGTRFLDFKNCKIVGVGWPSGRINRDSKKSSKSFCFICKICEFNGGKDHSYWALIKESAP